MTIVAQVPVSFADRIAAVSETFMNATIQLRNPELQTSTYDAVTGEYVFTGDPVVATGVKARIQPIRLAVDVSGSTSNPSGEVRIRVQIPRTAYSGKIIRGWQVRVLTADRNTELLDYLFVVDAAVDSSWRASHTIECSVNVENDPAWED